MRKSRPGFRVTVLRLFGVAVGLLAIACAPATDYEPAGYSSADSAGIELIMAGGSDAALDTLPLRRHLRIGAADGEPQYQFFRIRSIAADDAGRVHVLDGGSNELRVFDQDGRWIRTIGRQGNGPGEFASASRVEIVADRVVVVDFRHRNASVFDTTGALLTTIPLFIENGIFLPERAGGGRWLGRAWLTQVWQYEVDVTRRDTIVVMAAADSVLHAAAHSDSQMTLDTVLQFTTGRITGVAVGNAMATTTPLWEPSPAWRVDGAGRIYLTAAGPWQIDVFDPGGRLVRRIRRAHSPTAITQRMIDDYFDRVLTFYDTAATSPGSEMGIAQLAARRSQPRNQSLPALGTMYVAADGTIWVERPDLHPEPVALEWAALADGRHDERWDVIAPTGHYVGRVHLPRGFMPRFVTANEIFGIERDEFDIEYVVGYRFDPPT